MKQRIILTSILVAILGIAAVSTSNAAVSLTGGGETTTLSATGIEFDVNSTFSGNQFYFVLGSAYTGTPNDTSGFAESPTQWDYEDTISITVNDSRVVRAAFRLARAGQPWLDGGTSFAVVVTFVNDGNSTISNTFQAGDHLNFSDFNIRFDNNNNNGTYSVPAVTSSTDIFLGKINWDDNDEPYLDIFTVSQAVPEPSALMLGAIGLVPLLRRRRA